MTATSRMIVLFVAASLSSTSLARPIEKWKSQQRKPVVSKKQKLGQIYDNKVYQAALDLKPGATTLAPVVSAEDLDPTTDHLGRTVENKRVVVTTLTRNRRGILEAVGLKDPTFRVERQSFILSTRPSIGEHIAGVASGVMSKVVLPSAVALGAAGGTIGAVGVVLKAGYRRGLRTTLRKSNIVTAASTTRAAAPASPTAATPAAAPPAAALVQTAHRYGSFLNGVPTHTGTPSLIQAASHGYSARVPAAFGHSTASTTVASSNATP